MIQLTEVTARSRRAPKVLVGPVSFTLETPASYALVGTPDDGVALLLGLVAGSESARKGKVLVGGATPARQKGVAHVPYVPVLPGELLVAEYLSLAAKVRGEPEPSPRERLAVLGIEPLSTRRIRELAIDEARTVALTEALTSRASYLFLAEPLADLDPRATGRIQEALEARTSAGAFVVFSTTSPEDARTLGREQLHFQAGKLVRRTSRSEAWAPTIGPVDGRARLLIRSEGARLLLAELASDPTFDEVHGQGAELLVTGKDPIAMARAVAIASRHANAEIDLLTFETARPAEPAS